MVDSDVLFETKNRVGIITLNRPQVHNAMTRDMFDRLRELCHEVNDAPEVRALIVTGAGRGFCSGVDVSNHDFSSNQERRPMLFAREDTAGVLQGISKPTIAAVNGAAVGAGLGLALACDIRVASTEARFSALFARLGLPALDGVGWLLPRLVGSAKALELLYSGEMVGAEEAERIGLVSYVTPAEGLMDRALELAGKFTGSAPFALALSKHLVREALNRPYDDYRTVQYASSLDNRVFAAHDIQEAARARREKRDADFQGVEGPPVG